MTTIDAFPEAQVLKEDPNRRYTTTKFMAWIKEKCGVEAWDLDVAADPESHWADRWFGCTFYPDAAGVNGLVQNWAPPLPSGRVNESLWRSAEHPSTPEPSWRIFCNPPFDDLESWLEKTIHFFGHEVRQHSEYAIEWQRKIVVAFVLPGDRTEQPWWQRYIEPWRDRGVKAYGLTTLDQYNPPSRIAYGHPGNREAVAAGSPTFPSTLLVFRNSTR